MTTPANSHVAPRFAEASPGNSAELDRRRSGVLLLVLIAMAAILRFAHLGTKSLWFDEALTAWLVRTPRHIFARMLWRGGEANMALYYVIMRAWTRMGSSEWTLRSFSALAGVAAIPIFFGLAKRLFGTRVAAIAALLLTVNACAVAYSQEARSYALFLLLAILSTYFFVCVIESGATSGYAAYAITSALAVYAHFFAFLLVAAQWVSLVAVPHERIRWRKLVLSAIVFLLLAAPALFFVVGRDTGQLAWVPKASLRDLQRFGYFLVADQGVLSRPLLAGYIVLAALGVIFYNKDGRGEDPFVRWKVFLLVCWFIVPLGIALVVSMWKPVFVARFLIFCLAPLLLLAAAGLAQIRIVWLQYALTLTLAMASLVPTFWYYRQPKEQWREAVDYIARHAEAGDSVILWGNYARVPFEYYRNRVTWASGVSVIPIIDESSPSNAELHGSLQAWILMHGHPTDSGALKLQRDLASQYNETSEEAYFMVTVQRFSRPKLEQKQ